MNSVIVLLSVLQDWMQINSHVAEALDRFGRKTQI